MFLRCTTRKKNGKEHRYWNLVENRRVTAGQVVQRQVLYLGDINDSQQEVWRKSIEVFEDGRSAPRTVALFAEDQRAPVDDEQVIQVRLKDLAVRNARQWGACWLACGKGKGSRLWKRKRVASIQNTNGHQENGILLFYKTHMYCVFAMLLHGRSHGSRNPGGLPRSMVSCFESRNREASDLPLDALL